MLLIKRSVYSASEKGGLPGPMTLVPVFLH